MHMPKHTWVMVADGAHAQLFVPDDEATTLVPAELPGLTEVEIHDYAKDTASDRPGRTFSSSSGGPRHAIEPHHDAHKMEKHKLAAAVAKALDHACGAGQFQNLILIAPKRSVGELRSLLSERVQDRIVSVIPKDLTKASIPELWLQVGPIVRHPPLTKTA